MHCSRYFVRLTVLALGIGAVIISYPGSANAQILNGIFGIRSSEHFFQAGLERMEQEIEALQARNDEDIEVLTVDESVDVQRQDLENEGVPDDEPTDGSFERAPKVTF